MRTSRSLSYGVGPYDFHESRTAEELEALYRLNHRIFAEEIPQHGPSGGRLVDKFDHKNRYFVALRDGRLVGMLAAHGEPPFSAAEKLREPRMLDAVADSCLEVRLLAVERPLRGGLIFAGLCYLIHAYARRRGYRHLLISGFEGRVSLYERLGFRPLGPAVQQGEARFVPMLLTLDEMPRRILRDVALWRRHVASVGKGRAQPGEKPARE